MSLNLAAPRNGAVDGRHQGGGLNLVAYLEQEVIPRLTPDVVFDHPAHAWQKAGDKWRGGCPWHASDSGTSFNITISKGLSWFCAGCGFGGGPVQYRHRLKGKAGSPRGVEFVEIVRELCALADVPFPERELTLEQRERCRKQETRRGVLQLVYEHCRECLSRAEGADARAYLARRGFNAEAVDNLGLGLFTDWSALDAWLTRAGYSTADVRESAIAPGQMVGYVVFPWHDDCGRPLTLYGKWPGVPTDRTPKTMALPNPKQGGHLTPDLEHTKRSPLYFDRALAAGHRHVVLVEGVTDAALPQTLGDTRVIACVAGLLSADQIATLARRRIEAVVIALDPDTAGDNNLQSNVERLAAAGVAPYVAPRLPDDVDPDEFILDRGIDAWRDHVGQAVHGYRHVARLLIDRHKGVSA